MNGAVGVLVPDVLVPGAAGTPVAPAAAASVAPARAGPVIAARQAAAAHEADRAAASSSDAGDRSAAKPTRATAQLESDAGPVATVPRLAQHKAAAEIAVPLPIAEEDVAEPQAMPADPGPAAETVGTIVQEIGAAPLIELVPESAVVATVPLAPIVDLVPTADPEPPAVGNPHRRAPALGNPHGEAPADGQTRHGEGARHGQPPWRATRQGSLTTSGRTAETRTVSRPASREAPDLVDLVDVPPLAGEPPATGNPHGEPPGLAKLPELVDLGRAATCPLTDAPPATGATASRPASRSCPN